MNIEITQKEINESSRRDSHHCMIADAIVKKFPSAKHVRVDLQAIRFSLDNERLVYLTPPPAQVAIIDFDQGRKVRPFSMRLANPKKSPAGFAAVHHGMTPKQYRKARGIKDNGHGKPSGKSSRRRYPTREREFGVCKMSK